MSNDTRSVDRLARALLHGGDCCKVPDPTVEEMRRVLAGLSVESAALVERRLLRMAQAVEELGPDAGAAAIKARALSIRDT